ncbi:MAG: helix-turn-helix transcriptional regulator [Thaumarchaeota archaeon]|jgi:DNA-binding HxlR family transcriptional regulator|nr:MAG: helix-turn-helix transcriptional regulator [Nitrososphaerota archaeon]TLX89184.1 MAG: helix-turn-helix transcriptional regulator [Nitrososphaerota archaeon]
MQEKCEVLDIWEVLGKRWSLNILRNLSAKDSIRFNELKRLLHGISSTVLSERLRELELEGLIYKKIYPEIPLRVEYSLTVRAKDLEPILHSLANWVNKWKTNDNKQANRNLISTRLPK